MICSFQGQGNLVRLTVAIGDNVVMDALNISPTQARKDRDSVDKAADLKLKEKSLEIKPH